MTHQDPEALELRDGSLRNHFLIAMPSLVDPIFTHTITYICDHSNDGALGVVINQPLNIQLKDIFQQLQLDDETDASRQVGEQQVLSGGPVQMDRGFVLHPAGLHYESTLQVSPEISLTASRDILVAMATGKGPEKSLVALGYAGWEAGQLEAEISNNSWLTVPADPSVLFDTPCEQRWSAACKPLGFDIDRIHGTAGHA